MDQRKRRVAAEDHASLTRHPVAERLRQALDADDRGDAERDADEEDPQAREAAAQVAQREAQDRRAGLRKRRGDGRVHAGTSAASSTAPERIRMTRSQRAASAGSWVTSASVAPRRAGSAKIRSMIARPVASSRLPVGSSAISSDGLGDERAGERHPLLLAAGKLGGIVAHPFAEADLLELRAGAGEGVADAGEFERRGDVLERRHGRDEVEGLEHDADAGAAKARERVLAQGRRGSRRRSRPRRGRDVRARP